MVPATGTNMRKIMMEGVPGLVTRLAAGGLELLGCLFLQKQQIVTTNQKLILSVRPRNQITCVRKLLRL